VVQDLGARAWREAAAADAFIAAPQTRLPGVLPSEGVPPALTPQRPPPADSFHSRFDLRARLQHGMSFQGQTNIGGTLRLKTSRRGVLDDAEDRW